MKEDEVENLVSAYFRAREDNQFFTVPCISTRHSLYFSVDKHRNSYGIRVEMLQNFVFSSVITRFKVYLVI
jgi:hypothetical protein